VISFAQNAEDVVLARALPGQSGFYVDVGAAHPDIASVTRHFYELGWHGINIDPRGDAIEALNSRRPRDLNLKIAAGDHDGVAEFYRVVDDPDLSSTSRGALDDAIAAGHEVASEVVEVQRLDTLLAKHNVTTIDFLKIDVEGSEAAVLRGLDLGRWRPRVIVIEAVRPWSRVRVDHGWRTTLEAHGYRECSFDGVNLFFAVSDDNEVVENLAPASVLDDYEPAGTALLRNELESVRTYVKKVEEELRRHTQLQSVTESYVRDLEMAVEPQRQKPTQPLLAAIRPDRMARFAIVGTPRTGNTWIRRVIADCADAIEIPVHHPSDVSWDNLPQRFVIQVHWPRTVLLDRLFKRERVTVISAARHPLDVLLSILTFSQRDSSTRQWLSGKGGDERVIAGCDAHSSAFTEWALSRRARLLLNLTPQWWETPGTIRARYEHLVANANSGFEAIFAAADQRPKHSISESVSANTPDRLSRLSGGVHVWKARPGMWRELLSEQQIASIVEAHNPIFRALGYETVLSSCSATDTMSGPVDPAEPRAEQVARPNPAQL
jgi:FkbM family methyltransferase